MKIRDPKKRDAFLGWMDGYMSAAEDMPDGAWESFGVEAVEIFNKEYGTNYDPFDAWLYWSEQSN